MTNQELRDRVRKEIIEEGKAIERRIEADGSLKDLKMPEYRDHGLIMPGVMNR